ncbi:MAG: BON domain-containing protein [Planctomycetes bacterium]|nr:BON domain-containing protein [Planctomycetota bacterium]
MKPLVAVCLAVLMPALALPLRAQQLVEGVLGDADIAVLVRQAIASDAARSAMSADSLGRAANVRPDVDVARDVRAVLEARLGKRLDGFSVTCKDGVVVLTGGAASDADAQLAVVLADAVPGARQVENRLTGSAAAGTPAAARAAAAPGPAKAGPFAFLTKDSLAAADVTVEVDKGVVRLRGIANSMRTKEMATATARLVSGVRSVVNAMDVRAASRSEDERLGKLIERRIEWSTEVLSSFTVEVDNGIARVSGTARHGPAERDEVVHLASTTQGILVVDDRIVVP